MKSVLVLIAFFIILAGCTQAPEGPTGGQPSDGPVSGQPSANGESLGSSQMIDPSEFTEADLLFVEYFKCLSAAPTEPCSSDNQKGYSGQCIKIDNCSKTLLEKRMVLKAEGKSEALRHEKLREIWYQCYFGGIKSPVEGIEGPSYSSTQKAYYLKPETTQCWEGLI